jgi:hypothetical protein
MAQRLAQIGLAIQKVGAGPSKTLRAGALRIVAVGTRSRAESHIPPLQSPEPGQGIAICSDVVVSCVNGGYRGE